MTVLSTSLLWEPVHIHGHISGGITGTVIGCGSSVSDKRVVPLQALDQTRAKAEAATAAADKAEKAVASLEVDIPKAEMEVKAQQQRADDLKDRLAELRSNTQVTDFPYELLSSALCR